MPHGVAAFRSSVFRAFASCLIVVALLASSRGALAKPHHCSYVRTSLRIIESSAAVFEIQNGRAPHSVREIVEAGLLADPSADQDPWGGKIVIVRGVAGELEAV